MYLKVIKVVLLLIKVSVTIKLIFNVSLISQLVLYPD